MPATNATSPASSCCDDSLQGLNAVVLGASRGMGKAIAEALAAEGCNLCLLARSKDDITSLASTLNSQTKGTSGTDTRQQHIKAFQCDLLSDASVDEAFAHVTQTFGGKIDILINNAGVGGKGVNAMEAKWEDWEKVLMTDLRAVMRITTKVLPLMKDSKRASIINIASIAGQKSNAGNVDYCAAKAGLRHFSNTLFEDVRANNIKVCAICPGYVNTPMVSEVDAKKENMIQPEDIARTVLFVCKFPKTGCPTEITIRPQLPC
ncbi:hypothetical protein HDV00_008810 [Rhizophlyctis rosea]|nr:hypothetical protein HDV00_008810 [Rhizophlyctis rosea]